MAQMEEIDYTRYSGAQLLDVLENVSPERARANYEAVRREIARRPAPADEYVGGKSIVLYASLPKTEKRLLLRQCLWQAAFLQIQYALLCALLLLISLFALKPVLRLLGVADQTSLENLILIPAAFCIPLLMFWSYTKWLLHAGIGPFSFVLIRREPSPQTTQSNPATASQPDA